MEFIKARAIKILGATTLLLFTLTISIDGQAEKNKKKADTEQSSQKTKLICTSDTRRDRSCTGSGLRNVRLCYRNGKLVSKDLGRCVE